MGVLRYKILRDLWNDKGRTMQVLLIIGIGAAALGMILGIRDMIIPMMGIMWREINPAPINLFVGPPVNDDELVILSHTDGVEQIEGLSSTTIEWRLSPEDEWQQGGLTMRADYENQQLNLLESISGDWPTDEVLSVGQDAEAFFGIPSQGTIYMRVNETEHVVQLGGMLYSMFTQPAYFGGTAQFYITQDHYEKLVGDRNYNQLYVSMSAYSEDGAIELADQLQEKLEKQGKDSGRFLVDPAKHFFQDQLDGLFFLLGVLGALALILGLLLVYNTINAIIAQQVDQIGVMKAVGARTWQVVRLYFITILAYSVLALLIAIPIGVLGAWGITSWLIGSFGADPGDFTYSIMSIQVMVLICLLAPLLASLIPIYSASRITVREAITTYGLSKDTGLLVRLLSKAKIFSRMVLITISNTFRHKRRVALLQIALILSGMMFMMVISVRDSVVFTVRDVIFDILNADITMAFEQPYRINYLEEITLAHPAVSDVEIWGFGSGTIRPAGQEESDDDEQLSIFGVPLPTDFYGYQLREGRWLDRGDEFAIVLNRDQAEEVGVGVGDWVTIKYGEKEERDWRVVGLVFDPLLTTVAMVQRDVLLRDIGFIGRSSVVWVRTFTQDPLSQIRAAKDLRNYYEDNHLDVSPQRGIFGGIGGDASVEVVEAFINQFNFLIVLLGIMAIVIAAVGSIALSGALSLSVMERRREIGVMRAIGASSWAIFRLFIGEGILLGWLSWLIAVPLAIPAGRIMVQALGEAFQIDMIYQYTPMGMILWFFIITILSILASWLPARGATRISVRESLAYQ
ncbi:MAG: FtsX-like permease family protein [Anaerolineales bacterium]|jgi:putative ABC transport system permease protein